MKKVIEEIEHQLTCEIKHRWEDVHWGAMPRDVFERMYEQASDRIVEYLVNIGLGKDNS